MRSLLYRLFIQRWRFYYVPSKYLKRAGIRSRPAACWGTDIEKTLNIYNLLIKIIGTYTFHGPCPNAFGGTEPKIKIVQDISISLLEFGRDLFLGQGNPIAVIPVKFTPIRSLSVTAEPELQKVWVLDFDPKKKSKYY